MKLSVYSKAIMSAVIAMATAIAATMPNSTLGKWCVAVVAFGVALGVTAATKNTQVITTGTSTKPLQIGTVVSDTGAVVGTVTADTGAAVGGVVAGTTGVVGSVLDGTIGKLLPK